jgi:hydroxymethylbilane synthase
VYPIILDVREKRAVVVGGGSVAERKILGLLDAQADIVCVAPATSQAVDRLAREGRLRLERRAYEAADLDGATLVFAATDDDALNAKVVADARTRGVLVNDASSAERGDFATPATVRAGSLLLTVDSAGNAPAFVKRIRDELAERFDARYARATETLGRMREYGAAMLDPVRRADVLRRLARLDVDALATMSPTDSEHAVDEIAASLDAAADRTPITMICASRGSRLALAQARSVMARLAEAGIVSTIETVTTSGDRFVDRPIAAIGTDNVFVKEIEVVLRERRADYAVHSCKDLPGTLPEDMQLAAVTAREDPRDVFCSERFASFESLPSGARVGTSSPRRRAQLARLRPDLHYDDIRGNVDTRLGKLENGYDAIVLAMAGLNRLEKRATYTVAFEADRIVPAVGQGALAVEMRAGDPNAARVRAVLADEAVELAIFAERAFLRAMRGGCRAPLGAYGLWSGGTLGLTAVAASPDGARILRGERIARVADRAGAEWLGEAVAEFLLSHGAANLILDRPLAGNVFLLPRTQERPSRIAPALRAAGAEVIEAPDSATATRSLGERLPHVILFPSSGSVAAIAEYLSTLRQRERRPIVAAMGPASSAAAEACGFPPDVVAANADVGSLIQSVTRYILAQEEASA